MAGTAAVVGGAPVVHRPQGVKRIDVVLTTNATADGGDIAETVIGEAYGRLVGVFYDGGCDASAVITLRHKPGAASTVGVPLITFTTGTEGTPVFFRPSTVVADNAGTAIVAGDGSGGGTTGNDVNRDIVVAGKLTLEVANMGVSESGRIAFIFDETPVPPTFDKSDLS